MKEIRDWNSLANKIGQYLNRTDSATIDQMAMFINIAESNVYRDLRVPTMEARAVYKIGMVETVSDDNGATVQKRLVDSIRVPHNFLTLRSIVVRGTNQVVRPKAWTEFTREKSTVAALPDVYARDGDTFFFNRLPNYEVEIEMLYYRSFDDLYPGNVLNSGDPRPFLTVTYDAWLYGALTEAATYLGDDRFDYFLKRYDGAIASLNQSAQDLELSGGALEVSINSD